VIDLRRFPVINKSGVGVRFIPWEVLIGHENQAMANHSYQTLEMLARRGGLSFEEILAILEDRKFSKDPDAEDKVLAIVKKFSETKS